MKVKIDTKEKFHVLALQEPVFTANMTDGFRKELLLFLQKDLKNVVLKMKEVTEIDELAAGMLAAVQQKFYENNASFVICEINPAVEERLDNLELLELMNVTPTESEAWDIVQLEEIERELLG
ncbi:MAG: STAS domain-containing protein [Ginsengibacter sp.]